MLGSTIFSYRFFKFVQNGLYVDFIFKRFIEVFMRNILVYSAQFFGEKYLIEYWTKKIFSNSVFNINKSLNKATLYKRSYFLHFIFLLIYSIVGINLVFIIFF